MVTEPLILFDDGMKSLFEKKGKYCWIKDKTNTPRLGDGPRQIFRQVGKALHTLNKMNLFSNNIGQDIFKPKHAGVFGLDVILAPSFAILNAKKRITLPRSLIN